MKHTIARLLAACALAAMLSACNDKPAGPAVSPAVGNPATPPVLLPQADGATPQDSYIPVSSGNQLMYSYLALSGMPVDYEAVAQRISREYNGTGDAFRKQAVLDALKPRIDAEVQSARGHRYLRYQIAGQGTLEPYAMAQKAFPSKLGEAGAYYYMFDNSEYKLALANGGRFALLQVPEEAARKIEAARSAYRELGVVLYLFAQDVDIAQRQVKAQIVRVGIVLNGEEIAAVPAMQ